MASTNADQRSKFLQRRQDAQTFELEEGKKLVEKDQADIDLERQLVAFKKQMFANELVDAWQRQNQYKKNMKVVEDEC